MDVNHSCSRYSDTHDTTCTAHARHIISLSLLTHNIATFLKPDTIIVETNVETYD